MSELPVIQIPARFEALARPKRLKVFFGGRGSGKSETFARQLLVNAESTPRYKVLCTREYQNSIDDSVHGMLKAFVDQYQFPFEVQNTVINTPSGGYFKFFGLSRNVTSIKSKFDYNVVWVEEAEDIKESTWDLLIPTIRKTNSEIWASFNPADEASATYQLFVKPYLAQIKQDGFYEDEQIYVGMVNYDDNPFFPAELRQHSEQLKQTNFKKWLHVYGGEPNMQYQDALIEPEWFDAAVDAHVKLGFVPRGEKVCGFDPADTGTDAKARTLRHGVLIVDCCSWLDGDITEATQRAVDDAVEFRATDFIYDNVGNGASVKTYASMGGQPAGLEFHGFGAAESPDFPNEPFEDVEKALLEPRTNADVFKNKRAQYWWYLRERFFRTWQAVEKQVYHDPLTLISISSSIKELAALKSELVKVPRKRTAGSRLIQIVSKDEMRAKGIASPNLADSLMKSFAIAPKPNFVFERRPVQRRR